jgi:signal peptidase
MLMISAIFTYLAMQFGWRVDAVISGSMEPELPTGAIVVTRPVTPESIEIGDVITFHSSATGNIPITHRVIEIGENSPAVFRTKGDAAETRDPFTVPASNVIGKVCFSIPCAGSVISFLKTRTGFYSAIVIPTIILLILYFRMMILEFRKNRIKKAREAAG